MSLLTFLVLSGRIITVVGSASFLGRIVHARVRGRFAAWQPFDGWLSAFHITIASTALLGSLLSALVQAPPSPGSVSLLGYPIAFVFANIYLNKRIENS